MALKFFSCKVKVNKGKEFIIEWQPVIIEASRMLTAGSTRG